MKKEFQPVEVHGIELHGVDISRLAEASDEEFLAALRQGGYYENKICYQANPGFVTREVVGEVIAVPVGEQTKTLNGMVTFSETGAFLWKLLAERRCTKADLTAQLAAACGKQEAEIAEDVSDFLQKAEASGLVIREGLEG